MTYRTVLRGTAVALLLSLGTRIQGKRFSPYFWNALEYHFGLGLSFNWGRME
ncbi:MAG: hypothetical protein M3Y08_05665 [Fibrobacterota bacterium]|nr:hypothetical protein [Fibrobacterota bacterium]